MLSFEEAKKIGIDACIEKLGREFVDKYPGSSSVAYGKDEDEKFVFCFVGVDDNPRELKDTDKLVLTSGNKFPYRVSCSVELETGNIVFLECVLPK